MTGPAFATRSEVFAAHGMAATSQPLATQIAVDILKSGGSAVDAAIAANAALGLMEPTGCGIGGDLFAIVWDPKTKKLHGLNGSGRSPAGLSLATLRAEVAKIGRTSISSRGFLPISVPGAVDGWFELHRRFGKRPIRELLAPTISYAREGFPLSEYIAYRWDLGVREFQAEPLPGDFLPTYAPAGSAPRKGEMFKNPALAATLSLLAEEGSTAFYRGTIAGQIDAFMRTHGGYLRRSDLEHHTSTWVDPISTNYRGYDVYEMPPNTQGLAVLQMLNIIEGFDLRKWGLHSAEALHIMVEAKKLAFEDRAKYYADPAFCEMPLRSLLSKDYAAQRRRLIEPHRAALGYEAGLIPSAGDTICLSTADAEGCIVSLIQSNFNGLGSGIVVPGLGFCFQNRGEMFVLDSPHANGYAPGKRPLHTIIPAFVLKDGAPWLSLGFIGGEMQPQGHVQILCNLIDFDLNFQAASDAARWNHAGSTDYNRPAPADGGTIAVESGMPAATIQALMQRGHQVRLGHDMFGGCQAIHRTANGTYVGVSESRKDGHAAGY